MTPPTIGTELEPRNGALYSGFVDLIDSRRGARGWALNHVDPLDPVRLLLFVGDQAVAETFASGERSDIVSPKLGRAVPAGFAFDLEVMQSLSSFMDDPNETITVRVADSGHLLASSQRAPTVGEITAQLLLEAKPEPRSTAADLEFLLD